METGISNFHRMILTIEIDIWKVAPKTITFRDYKHFNKDNFERDLVLALGSNPVATYNYDQFLVTFENASDKHALMKRRKVRGNQMPFMNNHFDRQLCRHPNYATFIINQENTLIGTTTRYSRQQSYCVRPQSNVLNIFTEQHWTKLSVVRWCSVAGVKRVEHFSEQGRTTITHCARANWTNGDWSNALNNPQRFEKQRKCLVAEHLFSV